MLKAIANVPNWHRYLLGFLVALDAVCVAISTGAVQVPATLHDAAPWAALLNIFFVAFLPRVQLATGRGAKPILSPPPKNMHHSAVPLTPRYDVPWGTVEKSVRLEDGHLTTTETKASHEGVTLPPRG